MADHAAEVQRLLAAIQSDLHGALAAEDEDYMDSLVSNALAKLCTLNNLCALATAPRPLPVTDEKIERLADLARHEYYERREDGFGRTFTWIAVVRAVLAAHGGQR